MSEIDPDVATTPVSVDPQQTPNPLTYKQAGSDFLKSLLSRKFLLAVAGVLVAFQSSLPEEWKAVVALILTAIYSFANVLEK